MAPNCEKPLRNCEKLVVEICENKLSPASRLNSSSSCSTGSTMAISCCMGNFEGLFRALFGENRRLEVFKKTSFDWWLVRLGENSCVGESRVGESRLEPAGADWEFRFVVSGVRRVILDIPSKSRFATAITRS